MYLAKYLTKIYVCLGSKILQKKERAKRERARKERKYKINLEAHDEVWSWTMEMTVTSIFLFRTNL